MTEQMSFSYKEAGVNIDLCNKFIKKIKLISKKTKRPEVLSDLGGFSALCALPYKYKEPILVSSTDGVGTKLRLAIDFKRHDTIGIDLVAMCVNDLIVKGAEPLFFLDYYSTGKLDINTATTVLTSISHGCKLSDCALIGGETAEMPDMYHGKDYDIAGFCVGIVEKKNIINGSKIKNGDTLIALASSGPHSNGYSLIRKILFLKKINPNKIKIEDKSLLDCLLTPTRIYVKTLLYLMKKIEIHVVIHLTGGGFLENIPRILPINTQAVIYKHSWKLPVIFRWLQETGNIKSYEMYRTFNCGVGMIIAVSHHDANRTIKILSEVGEIAWIIGKIIFTKNKTKVIIC